MATPDQTRLRLVVAPGRVRVLLGVTRVRGVDDPLAIGAPGRVVYDAEDYEPADYDVGDLSSGTRGGVVRIIGGRTRVRRVAA